MAGPLWPGDGWGWVGADRVLGIYPGVHNSGKEDCSEPALGSRHLCLLCYRPVLSSGISPEGVSLPSRAGTLWRATKAPGFVSYHPVTLARSSSLNLFLCKMGSWCLLGFVTHVFNEICGVSGGWKGVALACPPFAPRAQEAVG